MKLLKGIGFSLLAILTVLCFALPIDAVPNGFASSARKSASDRLSVGGFDVDKEYVDASVNEAIEENLATIVRTTLIISALATLLVYCISFRVPHDAGGINLFNPLSIPLLFIIAISAMLTVAFALNAMPGRAVTEFQEAITAISGGFSGTEHTLLILLLLPVITELAFRGLVYSFIEKLHYIPAIIVSALAYGIVAYFAFAKYGAWSFGSTASAQVAFFVAFGVGLVLSAVTWRLRSVIPAVLMSLVMVNATSFANGFRGLGNAALPLSLILLAISLAALIFLPTLLAKRFPIFAYDFPFAKHHKRMRKQLGNKSAKRKATANTRESTKSDEPA